MIVHKSCTITLATFACLLNLGCSGRPATIKPPKIDAMAAAEAAMANFDQDADGSLSKQEACAGITNTWDRYDQDGDEAVTKEELAALSLIHI